MGQSCSTPSGKSEEAVSEPCLKTMTPERLSSRNKRYLLSDSELSLSFKKIPKTGQVLALMVSLMEKNNPKNTKCLSNQSASASQTCCLIKEVWAYHFCSTLVHGKMSFETVVIEKNKMIVADKNIIEKLLKVYKGGNKWGSGAKIAKRS